VQTGERIRVGVVDAHALMLAGVRALLSANSSPAVFVAGAETVEGLLRTLDDRGLTVDVVVLAVRLGDGSDPFDNVGQLARRELPVVLHADRSHREALTVAERAPAAGLVWKNDPPVELLRALVAVSHGGSWLPHRRESGVELTRRETEVLRRYAAGMTYAEVAGSLEPPVSVESVKTYLARVRRRYADADRPASTRLELRRRAIEDGLLPPE
jgi:DNA-binding NarL/FixJ family response regulator